MKRLKTLLIIGTALLLISCASDPQFDATGTFEADETLISAEVTGVIKTLRLEEGETLSRGKVVGYIDTLQLSLRKKQLNAQMLAVLSKQPDVDVQLAQLHQQLDIAKREQKRVLNLTKGDAATPKQLDEIEDTIALLEKQIAAHQSTLVVTRNSLNKETLPLSVQAEQVEDQLQRSRITNPVSGTVLAKYAEENEMIIAGRPIYKIADLQFMTLRAYVTGDQLPGIKLNQNVTVLTDAGDGSMKSTTGVITWISDKAEFTPKSIQTKNERANRVYAIKVKVANDGAYKIGMYGEIKFK